MSVIPYPKDEYIALVGHLAYAVTYLEGGILFDLSRHALALPTQLRVEQLTKQPTGVIARSIKDHVHRVTDADVETWLRVAGQHLEHAAQQRNQVLHGRPATIDGAQRLYYWRTDRPKQVITIDFLARAIEEVEQSVRDLEPLRVA